MTYNDIVFHDIEQFMHEFNLNNFEFTKGTIESISANLKLFNKIEDKEKEKSCKKYEFGFIVGKNIHIPDRMFIKSHILSIALIAKDECKLSKHNSLYFKEPITIELQTLCIPYKPKEQHCFTSAKFCTFND